VSIQVTVIKATCAKCKRWQTFTFHNNVLMGNVVASSNGTTPLFVRRDSAMVHPSGSGCRCEEPAVLTMVGKKRVCRCGSMFPIKLKNCPSCNRAVVQKSPVVGTGTRKVAGKGELRENDWEPDPDIDYVKTDYARQAELWHKIPDTAVGWQTGSRR
jgi:hypothetical protein